MNFNINSGHLTRPLSYRRSLVSLTHGVVTALALALFSCQAVSERKESDELAYFDLKSFVTEEITLLESRKSSVVKRMSADGKSETKVFRQLPWAKELQLFVQADINKPAYRSSYDTYRSGRDYFQYSLKHGENLPVQKLTISLDSVSGKPKLIEAVLESKNKLYHSEKKIELRCGQVGNAWMVYSYRIAGYQKLSFMEKRNFEVVGTIKI